jgi:tripartite-type tricarboxylate transporter receptor subunit TctC
MTSFWKTVLAAMSFAASIAASARAYSDKPIRVLHGFATGGGADVLPRTIVPQLPSPM